MKKVPCQICGQNPATFHFKQVLNGEVKEIYVCEACSEQEGFEFESDSLTDFLFGLGMDQPVRKGDASKGDRVCPTCQMRFSDYRKTSRLGCPQCYETFADDLAPALTGMHRGRVTHCGKVPALSEKSVAVEQVKSLQSSLQAAIAHQNFEEAARIRDQLHGKNGDAQGAGGGS